MVDFISKRFNMGLRSFKRRSDFGIEHEHFTVLILHLLNNSPVLLVFEFQIRNCCPMLLISVVFNFHILVEMLVFDIEDVLEFRELLFNC